MDKTFIHKPGLTTEKDDTYIIVYDPDSASHFSQENAWQHANGEIRIFNGRYTHKFDAVSHLVDYILSATENDSERDRTYRRELFVNAILSENALNVFYPELYTLILDDEKRCEDTNRHKP